MQISITQVCSPTLLALRGCGVSKSANTLPWKVTLSKILASLSLPSWHIDIEPGISTLKDLPHNPILLCSSLTVSVSTQSPPSPPQSLGCSPEWLRSTLLPRLARWCEEPKLNIAVTSLRLVPVDKYNDRYQDMKARYGRRLVEVRSSTSRQRVNVFIYLFIVNFNIYYANNVFLLIKSISVGIL